MQTERNPDRKEHLVIRPDNREEQAQLWGSLYPRVSISEHMNVMSGGYLSLLSGRGPHVLRCVFCLHNDSSESVLHLSAATGANLLL